MIRIAEEDEPNKTKEMRGDESIVCDSDNTKEVTLLVNN